jgi:hypothetical protein
MKPEKILHYSKTTIFNQSGFRFLKLSQLKIPVTSDFLAERQITLFKNFMNAGIARTKTTLKNMVQEIKIY